MDYGQGRPSTNPLSGFMYFVPLISPEHVSLCTNIGNTQCARVFSCHCHTNGATFDAICEFAFEGDGLERNEFSHDSIIRRRGNELRAGKPLPHQLAAISVEGGGTGSIEVEGTVTNGQLVVTEMQLRFNSHGHPSPVSVDLQDIVLRDGSIYYENEMVARVNTLTFRQKSDPPKMEVTLASVNRKGAGNSLWQNLVGSVKGAAANMMLPPLLITTNGNRAMLDFGLTLFEEKATFTFPYADRLTNGPPIKL
jgi:hypothetical protein